MEVSELKSYINRVLGNSLRCLLPSYWWKRLFGLMVDRIDEVEQKIDGIEIPDCVPIVNSESALNDLKLPNGSVASVKIDGYFSQCYLVSEADKGGGTETFQKLTRVRSIEFKGSTFEAGEVIVAVLIDVTFEKIISLYCGYGVPYGGIALCQLGRGEESVSFVLKTQIQQLNQILAEHDMRFFMASSDGMNPDNSEKNLAILDKAFAINISSDAYIKGESWERLVKERDLEGIGGGTAGGVEIRDLRVSSNLSEEDRAYNIETVHKYKEGKADVIIESVGGVITDTGRYDRFQHPSYVNIYQEGTSSKLATFRFVTQDMDYDGNTNLSVSGPIITLDVTIYTDGSSSVELGQFYDPEMSDASENAVQNKVVKKYVDDSLKNLKTINGQSIVGSGNIEIEGCSDIDPSNFATKDELTNLTNEMVANEEVHAAAYSDLDSRLKDIGSLISGVAVTKEEFQEGLQAITDEIVANEEVHAAAYSDLNSRLAALEAALSSINQ